MEESIEKLKNKPWLRKLNFCVGIFFFSSCIATKTIVGNKTYVMCEFENKLNEAGFCQVILFLNNHTVKDTFANFNGIYLHLSEIKGAAFKIAYCYSDYFTKKELLKNQFIVLKENEASKASGGMKSDSLALKIYNQIELMKTKWKEGEKNIQKYKNW